MTRLFAVFLPMVVATAGCERRDEAKPVPSAAVATSAEPRAAEAITATAPDAARELAFGDGQARFFVPDGLGSDEKVPFVLVLHSLGGTGPGLVQMLGLETFATAKRFLFAAPDGTLDAMGRRFWHANAVCCNFLGRDVNDVERLTALIDHAVGPLGADPKRVFVVGYSNGGYMAHRLACERSGRVRAIVSIAAAGPSAPQRCDPEHPVSVLEVHGDKDRIVPFEGGHLFGRPELPRSPSVRDGLSVWGRKAQCDGELRPARQFDLIEEIPGADTQAFRHVSCRAPSPILWKIAGAEHVIPLGPRAVGAIWEFLAEQR